MWKATHEYPIKICLRLRHVEERIWRTREIGVKYISYVVYFQGSLGKHILAKLQLIVFGKLDDSKSDGIFSLFSLPFSWITRVCFKKLFAMELNQHL